ncbi:MAG: PAS domain-containing protein [Methyloceanibacter sp.]
MTTSKDHAQKAAAALADLLRPGVDSATVAAIIEQALAGVTPDRGRMEGVEAIGQARASRLLSASPAVIYSFKATGDFAPTFVSDNLQTLFGYAPGKYLSDPNFWHDYVHPDDLARAETEISHLFEAGKQSLEYRFVKKDGTYCWVSDEQHLIRDEKGDALEVVGSWSDISTRKAAEASEDAARARLSVLL